MINVFKPGGRDEHKHLIQECNLVGLRKQRIEISGCNKEVGVK